MVAVDGHGARLTEGSARLSARDDGALQKAVFVEDEDAAEARIQHNDILKHAKPVMLRQNSNNGKSVQLNTS